ncbi:hypothetical protein BG011_008161 [Mortierella polycephala]|uniref:ERT1/acuK family PAS domain-containing protein n=1 Tax=Mortierella polycephala TaxID=41804 RepID=A0A9P6QBN5_9FUNG|nr:hypothetical protein BG011_008161 [Mortierella polycephala]
MANHSTDPTNGGSSQSNIDNNHGNNINNNAKDQQDASSSSSTPKTQQQLDEESAADRKKRAGPKRRKVTHGRPCQRCIKRSIGHLCHDEPKPSAVAAAAVATAVNQKTASASPSKAGTPVSNSSISHSPEVRKTSQQQQLHVQQLAQHQQQRLAQGVQSQHMNNNLNYLPMYGFNNQLAALPATLTFASEHMGNEFTVISDFLESLGDNNEQNILLDSQLPVNTTEKFFLTAADPSDGTNEDRLTQVINAKFEAGFLKPYNYVNGYSRLQKYMDSNMSNISRQRILNVMGTFRPSFRTVAQSLTDIDLVLVEEAFERLLLDYDRVFSSMGIPACLWRRTGEIYKGNKEFASLVNVPLEMLREGRLCIYELMAEESAVNYWEKYGNIAFDAGQKAVLTSCLLKSPDPENQNVISCCFSFTIRRDKYNIPTVIVGNFLPVSLG